MASVLFLPTGLDSPSVQFKKLLENEKNNFRLVNTAVSFLGGVPAMINPADMSNTIPNEKVRWKKGGFLYLVQQFSQFYFPRDKNIVVGEGLYNNCTLTIFSCSCLKILSQ